MNLSTFCFIVGLLMVYGGVGALDNGADIFPSLFICILGLFLMACVAAKLVWDTTE
jgi:hypothetical protein